MDSNLFNFSKELILNLVNNYYYYHYQVLFILVNKRFS